MNETPSGGLKKAQVVTYHSVLHNPNTNDVEMLDETEDTRNLPAAVEQKQDGKKKKRKKNKKSKKKAKGDQADNAGGQAKPEEDIEDIKLDEIKLDMSTDKEEPQDAPLDLDTNDPLFSQHNRDGVANMRINNYFLNDNESSQENNSQGKISFGLSKADQEFIEDTKKLGQNLLEELSVFS